MKLPEQSGIALKKHEIKIVNYTLQEPSFIVSYLSINFPKLVIHNIDIIIGTKYLIKLKWWICNDAHFIGLTRPMV